MCRKPNKIRKAGLLKIASKETSMGQSDEMKEEFGLWKLIRDAREAGDIKEAVRLIDLLIEFVEKAGKPSFEYQVYKMLMIDPGDFAKLIPIYEKQLNFYKRRNELMGQVDALVSLTAVCVNSGLHQRAKSYIDLAEGLILSRPNEMINLDRKTSITGINRIEAKLGQIRQAKKYIDEALKNDLL